MSQGFLASFNFQMPTSWLLGFRYNVTEFSRILEFSLVMILQRRRKTLARSSLVPCSAVPSLPSLLSRGLRLKGEATPIDLGGEGRGTEKPLPLDSF